MLPLAYSSVEKRTLTLDPYVLPLVTQRDREGDPLLRAAISVFASTNDLEDFVDTLARVAKASVSSTATETARAETSSAGDNTIAEQLLPLVRRGVVSEELAVSHTRGTLSLSGCYRGELNRTPSNTRVVYIRLLSLLLRLVITEPSSWQR